MRKMKGSGIAWIGEIPEEWQVAKVGYFYDIVLGKMLSPRQTTAEQTLENYLSAVNVQADGIATDVCKKMWFTSAEKQNLLLEPGDMVTTEGGNVGLSCLYHGELSPCYFQNSVHRVRPQNEQVTNEFLYYWMYYVCKSGYLDNVFFAFTATPKNRTLQIFGQQDASGAYVPFHIYSMRQAIEEHYILDVLQNYVTYSMYYKIIKDTPENPELDNGQAVASIKRFETLHPHNIAQKTEIIMEHFLRITRHKIGGRAKAMIVTASRLHAVRYLFAIRSYIEQHHLADDVGVLVAFSGEVEDGGERYTEPQLNVQADGEHISEKALPEAFHGDDFNVLVVAEKYQTGFDEPLLHTMFVDKKLSGVKAVQTLSRLNRICKGKSDTFVLDFVNTAEDRVLQQIADDFRHDPKAVNFAKHNDERMFYQSYYQSKFTDIILERFQQNDEFMKFVLGSEEAMRSIMDGMLHEVYAGLRQQ